MMFNLKLICVTLFSFVMFAVQASNLVSVKSNRFERLQMHFDEIQNECKANDVCLLVQISYVAYLDGSYKNAKHYGTLNPRIPILMIKPSYLTPWLSVSDLQNWLPLNAPLFPKCCGNSEGNGLVSEFIKSSKKDLSKNSLQLKVTVEFQKNIYKYSDILEVGSIHLSQMPQTHEIIAHPNQYSTPMDDSYNILKMVPLKIKNNIKMLVHSRSTDILNTYKLVGVPNPNPIDGDTEGTPFSEDFLSFAKPVSVYRLEFQDLSAENKIVSSLETADTF